VVPRRRAQAGLAIIDVLAAFVRAHGPSGERMHLEPWDPATIDAVVDLLRPAWPDGQGHRIRPRLLAGPALSGVTEVANDVAGRPVGVVHVSLDPTYPGVIGGAVGVAPGHRGRGLGGALATRASELLRTGALRPDGAPARVQLVVLPEESTVAQHLAEQHGFRVSSRSVGWTADLDEGTVATHQGALDELLRGSGLSIETATWASRGALMTELTDRVTQGLPRATGADDPIDPSLVGEFFFAPETVFFIAWLDGAAVGFSGVSPVTDGTAWYVEFTGVVPAARGRGVARAFKHAQFVAAAGAGASRLFTFNEEHNTAVIALNASSGMRRRSGYVGMVR
jgi:GNAT superfamily N-acetyltransferase